MNETNCKKILFDTLNLNKTNEGPHSLFAFECTRKILSKVWQFKSSNIRHKSPNKCSTVYKCHILCQKKRKKSFQNTSKHELLYALIFC